MADGIVVVGYDSPSLTSAKAVGGVCSVEFDAPGADLWRLSRVVVTSTSVTQPLALVYDGGVDALNFLDGTRRGGINGDPTQGDVAEFANPIPIQGGRSVIVQWTGMSAGSYGIARIHYELVHNPHAGARRLLA